MQFADSLSVPSIDEGASCLLSRLGDRECSRLELIESVLEVALGHFETVFRPEKCATVDFFEPDSIPHALGFEDLELLFVLESAVRGKYVLEGLSFVRVGNYGRNIERLF